MYSTARANSQHAKTGSELREPGTIVSTNKHVAVPISKAAGHVLLSLLKCNIHVTVDGRELAWKARAHACQLRT